MEREIEVDSSEAHPARDVHATAPRDDGAARRIAARLAVAAGMLMLTGCVIVIAGCGPSRSPDDQPGKPRTALLGST